MVRRAENLPGSVHQRLLNKARESGRPFNQILQHFAIERFLYRLSRSTHGSSFILKGALMFFVWKGQGSRPTLDIDLSGRIPGNPDVIISAMREACMTPVEPDGMIFDARSVCATAILEDAEYQGIRCHLKGNLGRADISLQLDIGFGDAIVPGATEVTYPALLDFPSAQFQGYTMESTIAEKFQAMVKFGVINSRAKDFYDVWLLSVSFPFDGATLARALTATFKRRGTPLRGVPSLFEASFSQERGKGSQWRAFITKSKITGAPQSFEEVVVALNVFLKPVWVSLSEGQPFVGAWKPGGPWQKRT